MVASHRAHVEELICEAEAAHRDLLAIVSADVRASLPVDAQGITRAIDHIAQAVGLSPDERRQLVQPHAVNPAVLHARVFGAAALSDETVIGAFVEGARVRAEALVTVADELDDQDLLRGVREILIEHTLPTVGEHATVDDPAQALRDAYAAQERAALLIAGRLDNA